MRASKRLAIALMVSALAGACTTEEQVADIGGLEDGEETGSGGKADGWGSAEGKTLVLRGTVITMDSARGTKQVLTNAAVVVKGQKITAILESGKPLPTGSDVVVLPSRTGTSDFVITPGLINAHNHLAYNTAEIYKELPLYENTYQWRDESYYDTHIQLPKRLLGECSADVAEMGIRPTAAGDRMVEMAGLMGRYAEVKELAGGTTTTQGSFFGTTVHSGYGQHMVRNLDNNSFGTKKRVSQTALGVLVDSFDPRPLVAKMDAGELDAWLVHLLEGTDQESRDEFDCLKSMGLVRKELMLVHGTALTRDQLKEMARVGAKLVASPLDNLLYYGQSADIKTAWELGVNVSIGTDWSPAGSKNLLAELKVLDLLNKQVWGSKFTGRDMLEMVTTNPSDAIGWTKFVGRVKVGLYADLAVFKKRSTGDAYRAVIDASDNDVRLVLVGGDPLYGDVSLMKKLKPDDYETLASTCGFSKAVDITTTAPKVQHGDITFTETRDMLEDALKFDFEWLYAHSDDVRAGGLSKDAYRTALNKQFPYAMTPRAPNPIFVCEDKNLLEEIRSDANVRTAYQGVCLDLRPWYGGATMSSCGAMPAHPDVLTTEEHDGNLPQRPPAWCAAQNWATTGELPRPPR